MPFINGIGPLELIIVLVIALLVIGPGKLPEVGSALGKSIREFRKASSDVQEAAKIDTTPLPGAPATAATAAVAPVDPAAPAAAAPAEPVATADAVALADAVATAEPAAPAAASTPAPAPAVATAEPTTEPNR